MRKNELENEMVDGFYKVEFGTPLGSGTGVVLLANGEIRGGDASLYYFGTYAVEQGRFVANVSTNKHSSVPGVVSVFGRDRVQIDLNGSITENLIDARGQSPEAPGLPLTVRLTRLAT